ncbi:MAG: transposase [Candidatus Bathyarchaeia archaeon]|nr:transposase [Candidatus Bathyarchaeota archaeon A05DMB-3]
MRPSLNPIKDEIRENKSLSLELLFDSLDLSSLWPSLLPKYSLNGWVMTLDWEAMFKALLLKEMWKIDSRRKLVKLLESNEYLLRLCGFDRAPAHNTFSKFVKRLGSDVFERMFYELVAKIREYKEVGRIVAIDSTLLKGYARD